MTYTRMIQTLRSGQAGAAAPSSPATRLLAERVRQCVPARHPAFGKLLQLLSIEITQSVPTAAVTVGRRSRLLINPRFVAERCRTDAHLSMLVMHELYHVLLGHTRLYRRPDLVANWAFDCIVNAQLCRQYPSAEYTSFFSAGAAPDGPWSLIGPPPGWPDAPRYAANALGEVHRRLYDDTGVTTAELFALLVRFDVVIDPADAERLLGNHADEAEGTVHADPDLLAEIQRAATHLSRLEESRGAGDGAEPFWGHSKLRRNSGVRRAVRALLQAAARGEAGGRPTRGLVESVVLTPIPQAGDRRAQLQRLLGVQPLWWAGQALQPGWQRCGQITVYLDVSGSMTARLPVLLDTLRACADLVRWPLMGFSTEVHPLSRADLADGRFRTTGGTDIACVAEHILATGVHRAVVITDGVVREVPASLLQRLQRNAVRVCVGLPEGCDAAFAARAGWPVIRLPAIDGATH